jgi:hypothetical protein
MLNVQIAINQLERIHGSQLQWMYDVWSIDMGTGSNWQGRLRRISDRNKQGHSRSRTVALNSILFRTSTHGVMYTSFTSVPHN